MSKTTIDNPILGRISILNVIELLKKRGWKNVDHPNDKILLFEGPADDQGRPVQLIIPRDENLEDANSRLAEAFNVLAAVHREPLDYVIERAGVDRNGADQAITHITNSRSEVTASRLNALFNKTSSSVTLRQRILANVILLACAGAVGAGLISFYSQQTLWRSLRMLDAEAEKTKATKLADLLSATHEFETAVDDFMGRIELRTSDSGSRVYVRIPSISDAQKLRTKNESVQTQEAQLVELLNGDCTLLGADTCLTLKRYVADTVQYYADVREGTATLEQRDERARVFNDLKAKLKRES